MKKGVYLGFLFVFCMSFLSGCSMMPDDEEIIKGSVLETEIFGDELINDEELMENDEGLKMDDEKGNIDMQDENDDFSENGEDSELDSVVVDVM